MRIALPLFENKAVLSAGEPLRRQRLFAERGAELAFEEINQARGLPFAVELKVFRYSSADAAVARLILTDPAVVAVLGRWERFSFPEAASLYAEAGLAVVLPFTNVPETMQQKLEAARHGAPNVFSLAPSRRRRAESAIEFAGNVLKAKSMAVLYRDPPGALVPDFFSKTAVWQRDRAKILGLNVSYFGELSLASVGPTIQKLRRLETGAIAVQGEDAFAVAIMAHQFHWDVPVILGDVYGSSATIAWDRIGNAYLAPSEAMPLDCLPGGANFKKRFRARFGDDPEPVAAYAHEGAMILLAALASGPRPPSRSGLLGVLRRIKYKGVLGVTSFDEKGETQNPALLVMRRANVRDRAFEPVKP